MTGDEIMRDEMLKAGEDPKLVELLFRRQSQADDPLARVAGRNELDAEAEADLRAYTRKLLTMPVAEFQAYFNARKEDVKAATEIAKEIEAKRN